MSMIETLRVELGHRSYRILIGSGLLPELEGALVELFPANSHAVVVYDERVIQWANLIADRLATAGSASARFQWPAAKPASASWGWKIRGSSCWHTDRGSLLIAVGGGVVGDLAGFAAATFARGIPLIQLPTTLLSQVDSSVGGKTGINLPGAKNIVGAFWQPSLVVIDIDTLSTLPSREFVSGLAEVAKYGVILLPELFAYLEQHAAEILRREVGPLSHVIAQSCRAKAMVVQEDEREISGRRAILNYGHTFAHAIEATTGYGTWLHGEAVAMGMHLAVVLAAQLGRISERFVERQRELLERLQLPVRLPAADTDALWRAMQHDKKVEHGALRFVLPVGELGRVELVQGISREQVLAAMNRAG